jgi:hypothetical protein
LAVRRLPLWSIHHGQLKSPNGDNPRADRRHRPSARDRWAADVIEGDVREASDDDALAAPE